MNNIFENFVSNFYKKGNISIIIKSRYDVKFYHFYKYLLSQKDALLITDSFNNYTTNKIVLNMFDETLLKVVETIKNKNVFISAPVNEWVVSNPKEIYAPLSKIYEPMYKIYEPMYRICQENNISLNLITQSYKSPNNTSNIPTIHGGNSIIHAASYVVNYENEIFDIIKNRYGINESFNINDFKHIMAKMYREKKLERICK